MLNFFRQWVKTLPTLLTAFILALAVWVLAVTSTDPAEERLYQQAVPIEIVSLDPALVITNDLPTQTNVILKAPRSIWEEIYADTKPIRAVVDLSGYKPGSYEVPVRIQVKFHPVSVASNEITDVQVDLERLESRDINVELSTFGSPASGYELGQAILSSNTVMVSGPESKVDQIKTVRATLRLDNTKETIESELQLVAIDEKGSAVMGVNISPVTIVARQEIMQRGGYRTLVVKVTFLGRVATGYRLSNITVSPPILTVYADDPQLVANLPGYIETMPLDLTGANTDVDLHLALNMPQGISLEGEPTVLVHVGVSPLEGSLTLAGQQIEITGLAQGLTAHISPTNVDVIISGPLPLINKLTSSDVHVIMDLSGAGVGTYQRQPSVTISIPSLTVDSILPDTLEVIISSSGTSTPKP